MRSDRDSGQASVEHLALVAFVAVVIAAASAVAAVAAPSVRNGVTTAFQRALCTVAGRRCKALDREPCPQLRTTERSRTGVALGFVRLGHDRALVVERRSDGSYAMTLVEGVQGGLGLAEGGAGGPFTLDVEASVMAGGRAGRTYTAATPAEARALVERLRSQHLPALRSIAAGVADLAGVAAVDPSVASYLFAGDVALDAAARFGLHGLAGLDVELGGRAELAVKVAAHERELTASLSIDDRASAFFDAFSWVRTPGRASRPSDPPRRMRGQLDPPGAGGDTGPRKQFENPLAVEAGAEAIGGGSVALRYGPGPTLLGVEFTGYVGTGAQQRELHARIDPSEPGVLDAVHAWLAHPASPSALRALGEAVAGGAALDERTFALRASHEHEFDAQVADLAALGFRHERGMLTAELEEQRSRPVGGVWETRLDCGAGQA